MNNSGYVIITEQDTNPNSATYGNQRIRVTYDTDLCPLGEESGSTTPFWLRISDSASSKVILFASMSGTTELTPIEVADYIETCEDEGYTNYIDIYVGDQVQSIQGWTFKNHTMIKSITLSSSVRNIKGDTQANSPFVGCTGLSALYCLSVSPPALPSNAFADAAQNFVIYVPAQSVSDYKTATNWSTYSSRIQAIPS